MAAVTPLLGSSLGFFRPGWWPFYGFLLVFYGKMQRKAENSVATSNLNLKFLN